jgi:signal transduction histidine kinase
MIEVNDGIEARLPPAVETTLYRVAQEALNNVVRHAKATLVHVTLDRMDGGVQCRVRDDGTGFDPAVAASQPGERGFGLAAIRERLGTLGGTLRIDSVIGKGTDLVMSVPIRK